MDQATIVTLTILIVLTLAILVLAGLVLSARSFTQLAELIRFVGSLVEQQNQATRQQLTTSLKETAQDIKSSLPGNGGITPGSHD